MRLKRQKEKRARLLKMIREPYYLGRVDIKGKIQKQKEILDTAKIKRICWTPKEDKMVLDHKMGDKQLALLIPHSWRAIQARRTRLKKLCA